MEDENVDKYLCALTHEVEDDCFVFPLPLMLKEPGEKQNSFVIIFSCWNTMIGTVIVALPWAYQQAGIAMGCLITFTSFFVSFYTCYLIIDCTGQDADFCVTLKKYYGKLSSHLLTF